MTVDANLLTEIVLRWIHFLAGITWIGLLYYFNLVQGPAFKALDASVRSQNIQKLVPRALWYFRYGALVTVLAGIGLLYMMWPDMSPNTIWRDSILAGGTLGIIMFLNVWVLIWPNQKKVIAANVEASAKQQPVNPESAKWAKNALYASRANFVLSWPMLWFMAASSHHATMTRNEVVLVGAAILALAGVFLYVYTHMKPAAAPAPPPAQAQKP